ncbi:hypothetical protein VOLCADRAFT_108238 [Volvox carteri f. nagariensis]|uniref:Uncharacterized protein n=1 Tax=Volvox carteri f. nagariensis TaxID=3068 RepID=D8UJ19_VOLCA|nr:uncharacterized protein VOLCADRAFT_108238 [Volvox carteri f. nagariensis]EFJ40271.1 hypothetical protein VOLCADRAFT_108238 [Volvox carteri f. nagariensis]|eukprot:XP_002958668.1 hypothetical protein VOLCADRAFT_108238 [Volvox carteri f. nagariensis]
MFRKAGQLAACALRSTAAEMKEAGSQQVRRMGGGGANLYHRTYNGKPVPIEFQGPDYVTYAGATIKKEFHAFDTYLSRFIGALTTFTILYHFSLNAEEHWHGDIYFFEKDVQKNGWDDENGHGHGHGHGHH